jgi:hypothetical protein
MGPTGARAGKQARCSAVGRAASVHSPFLVFFPFLSLSRSAFTLSLYWIEAKVESSCRARRGGGRGLFCSCRGRLRLGKRCFAL